MRIKLAIAVVATLATCALAESAQAGPGCSQALCVWTGKNYTGNKLKLTEPGELMTLPSAFDDKVSSVKNRWEFRAQAYENSNGSGQFFCLPSGIKIPDFSAFSDEFNNDMSSYRLDSKPGGTCGP